MNNAVGNTCVVCVDLLAFGHTKRATRQTICPHHSFSLEWLSSTPSWGLAPTSHMPTWHLFWEALPDQLSAYLPPLLCFSSLYWPRQTEVTLRFIWALDFSLYAPSRGGPMRAGSIAVLLAAGPSAPDTQTVLKHCGNSMCSCYHIWALWQWAINSIFCASVFWAAKWKQ